MTVMKRKKTLTKDSRFPVLNALLVPFLKERRVILRAHGKHKFITVISDLFSLLVSIIVNF